MRNSGPPVLCRGVCRDLGRLLPVIALMRDEVLDDDLLQMPELGMRGRERLDRGEPVLATLADPDQDPARERDPQIAGCRDRLQPASRLLCRRALMRDQIGVHGLEHQPLRGGHLTQPRQVVAAQHPKVGVGQQPALQRLLADPHDVTGEVLEPELAQLRPHPRVDLGALAGEHQQLLGPVALDRPVEQLKHLFGLVQMSLMRGERAVLAVATARPRKRQRDVPAECDAASHESPILGSAYARPRDDPSHTALAAALAAVLIGLFAGSGKRATAAAHGRAGSDSASLMLDFTPNAIHTGIYAALARHYDAANGISLQVRIPGQSTDAISLLSAGRVNFAILDIHDLAIADAQGHRLVGIMALEQRPLASVIAQPRFKSPKQLDGQTIGVTGDPSDLAVLHSVVAGAGGRPSSLKTITIGYNAVPDLLAGKVAAATGFWNDEGVQLSHQRPAFMCSASRTSARPPTRS